MVPVIIYSASARTRRYDRLRRHATADRSWYGTLARTKDHRLISSMRTPGREVIRDRRGRSLSGDSLPEAFSADTAVLLCRTALGQVVMPHGPKPSD
jgi:hypothetical protein